MPLNQADIFKIKEAIYTGLRNNGNYWADKEIRTTSELLDFLEHAKSSIREGRYNNIVKYINDIDPTLIRNRNIEPTEADTEFVKTMFNNMTLGQKKAMMKLCYSTNYQQLGQSRRKYRRKSRQRRTRGNRRRR